MTPIDPKIAARVVQEFFKDFDLFPAVDMPASKEAAHHLKLTAAVIVAELQQPKTETMLESFAHLRKAVQIRHRLLIKAHKAFVEEAHGTDSTH